MYARVTRFTGATPEQVDETLTEVGKTEGPPPGVPEASSLKVLANRDEGTVIFIGFFQTEEDLKTADAALREFNPPGGAPGEIASIDLCDVAIERDNL
jgi:hypothetical protein